MSSNRNRNVTSSRSGNIDNEVRQLIKAGKPDVSILSQLRSRYGNDAKMVDAVFDGYKDRKEYIQKKALKFKTLIFERYSKYNLSFPQLVKKARKYKEKYDLHEDEFQAFLALALNEKSAYNSGFVNNTALSKTLGHANVTQSSLSVDNNELDVLQEILRIHGETRAYHANVTMQSMMYQTDKAAGLKGEFKADKHNPYAYVHPVVAAMFMPKIPLFDEHMLIANLANIVKLKNEGMNPQTQPEFEVYWDLINDPNDTVCDSVSAIKDLRNRIILQTRLWDSVMNLREGNVFKANMMEFLMAVDNCRNNIYDVPDLTYVKDEGAIMRRLMSAFSLRPIVVSTSPIYGVMTNVPHMASATAGQLTNVPMLNLRLPLKLTATTGGTPVNLNDALSQAHWYVDGKMLVPKSQRIAFVRDVLVFNVNRRISSVQFENRGMPYNYKNMPLTMSSLQSINTETVTIPDEMKFGADGKSEFVLTSVVCLVPHTHTTGTMIKGCATFVNTNGAEQMLSANQFVVDKTVAYYPTETSANANTIYPLNATGATGAGKTLQNVFGNKNGGGDHDPRSVLQELGTVYIYTKKA